MASVRAEQLAIVVEAATPATRLAARTLARACMSLGMRPVRRVGRRVRRVTPQVRITTGSLVRPCAVVHFDVPFAPVDALAAEQLALTVAGWDSLDEREVWRDLSAPLALLPHVGALDWDKPWAVTLARGYDESPCGVDGHQLHVLGGWRPPPATAVWWLGGSRTPAAVLGRAAVVLGNADPLVFDAIRAGVAVRPAVGHSTDGLQPGGRPPALRFDGSLAGLVPASLLDEPRLWRQVAQTACAAQRDGTAPEPLMTPEWIAVGRTRLRGRLARPHSGWRLLRRRYDKLRRDPQRFLADSRFAPLRAFGRVLPR